MPGYSGLEVCQRLKDSEDTAHIPVLLTVGKLEPFKPDDARRVRADAHIVKPFEASELLTAVMKLEDRVVATKAEGSRHGGDNGRNAPGTDTGWKSRLGFPSKKKKEEKEEPEEEVAAGGNFREFRSGKGKSNASEAAGEKAASKRGANPVSSITPEELDALSAVAARLDGASASAAVEKSAVAAAATAVPVAVPTVAPVIESAKAESGAVAPVEAPAAKVVPARTEVKGFAVVASAPVEAVAAKEERADGTASIDSVTAVVAPVSAVDAGNEIEIPVEHLEVAAEIPAVAEASATGTAIVISENRVSENRNPGNQNSEASAVAVNLAAPAQQPASGEQSAQPVLGSAVASATASAISPDASAVLANAAESKGETAETQEPKVEALPAANAVVPVAARAPEAEAEGPSPSDEELAQALRLLTPASMNGEMGSGTAGAGGPRWVAESIALSGEEAAISLEAEMFGSFAAKPTLEAEVARITGVSAIAAAVETRLAAVGMAAGANAQPVAESAAASTLAATTLPAPVFEEAKTEQQSDSTGAGEKTAEKVSGAVVTEAVADDSPTATFASGGDGRDEVRAEVRESGDTKVVAAPETTAVAEQAAIAVTENRDSSAQAEAEESMRKDSKSSAEKSNGQQVSEPAAEEIRGEIAAMAMSMAAAAAEGSAPSAPAQGTTASSSSASSDAGAIASIVDSVMADLRPKIVEEIAKRLAGK
jgi:trimeric autotransporter adhesin